VLGAQSFAQVRRRLHASTTRMQVLLDHVSIRILTLPKPGGPQETRRPERPDNRTESTGTRLAAWPSLMPFRRIPGNERHFAGSRCYELCRMGRMRE
jgi:hypothetical protein